VVEHAAHLPPLQLFEQHSEADAQEAPVFLQEAAALQTLLLQALSQHSPPNEQGLPSALQAPPTQRPLGQLPLQHSPSPPHEVPSALQLPHFPSGQEPVQHWLSTEQGALDAWQVGPSQTLLVHEPEQQSVAAEHA
jgi:hypothetical protein